MFYLNIPICLSLLLSNAFAIAMPRNRRTTEEVGLFVLTNSQHHTRKKHHDFNVNNRNLFDDTDTPIEGRLHRRSQTCTALSCGGAESLDLDDETVRKSPSIPTAIGNWYMRQLDTHELRTKFISSAVLALAGDVVAQKVGHYVNIKTSTDGVRELMKLDKRRMMALFGDGLLVTGPLLHYIYEFYEWVLPTTTTTEGDKHADGDNDIEKGEGASASKNRFMATLAHVLFDNFVMIVVYVAVLMITTGIFEGRHAGIPHELKYDLIPAVKVSWKVSVMGFAPLQLLSFHFLPMKLRVLAVNLLDVIWVTVMSFVTHKNRH